MHSLYDYKTKSYTIRQNKKNILLKSNIEILQKPIVLQVYKVLSKLSISSYLTFFNKKKKNT